MLEIQVPPYADYSNAVNTLFCNTTTEGHQPALAMLGGGTCKKSPRK